MSFLGTATGQAVISTGKFNDTGLALVAGLAQNVANVTALSAKLAGQIDRAVGAPSQQSAQRQCSFLAYCPQLNCSAAWDPSAVCRHNICPC